MKNKAAFILSMRQALVLLRKVVQEMPEVPQDMADAMSYIEHALCLP